MSATEETKEAPKQETPPSSPKGPKHLDSFGKHANLFQSLFASQSALHSSVSSIQARNPRELEKTQDELRNKYSKMERENLEKIWDEFDVNKDGQLSKTENEALVREYFKTMTEWFPKMMDELLTSSMGFLDRGHTAGPAFDKMSEAMKPLYNEMFSSIQGDIPQMADEMWSVMDVNHDGKVVRDEFLATFDSCSNDIVNRITRRVLYSIFSNGNIDFAQFITDVDKEEPTGDNNPPDADAIALEHELKARFNDAVRDTAQEELARNVEPCSTDEFWHKVCTKIRGWLGNLDNGANARAAPGPAAGLPGLGGAGLPGAFPQFGAFGGYPGFPGAFGQPYGAFGAQQFGPGNDLYNQMQSQLQLQATQLQQAQAAAQAAQAQAAQAAQIAAQAQAQAQAAITQAQVAQSKSTAPAAPAATPAPATDKAAETPAATPAGATPTPAGATAVPPALPAGFGTPQFGLPQFGAPYGGYGAFGAPSFSGYGAFAGAPSFGGAFGGGFY